MRPERLGCPLSGIRRGNGTGEQEEEKRQQRMSATQDATQSGLRLKILGVVSCCYARAGRLLSTAPVHLVEAPRSVETMVMIETIQDHTLHPRYLGAQSARLGFGCELRIVRQGCNGPIWLPVHRRRAVAGAVRCYRRDPADFQGASDCRRNLRMVPSARFGIG